MFRNCWISQKFFQESDYIFQKLKCAKWGKIIIHRLTWEYQLFEEFEECRRNLQTWGKLVKNKGNFVLKNWQLIYNEPFFAAAERMVCGFHVIRQQDSLFKNKLQWIFHFENACLLAVNQCLPNIIKYFPSLISNTVIVLTVMRAFYFTFLLMYKNLFLS